MPEPGLGPLIVTPSSGEEALLLRVRKGDPDAFEQLIHPYESRVYRAVLRVTRNPTEAADVYQDALLAAFEKIDGFRGQAAFGTWLHRIAINCALMHRRAPAHTRVVSEEDLPKFDWMGRHDEPVRDWGESAEIPAQRAELRAVLQRALDALPEIDRLVVWMKDVEGECHETIADATGLTVSATRSRLHRARIWLRSQLAHHLEEER